MAKVRALLVSLPDITTMSTLENINMGTLSTKLNSNTPNSKQTDAQDDGIYYAVYIPPELLTGYENDFVECERVFDNKEKALLFIKKNKKIRFKSFRNFQEAQNFAYNGNSIANTSITNIDGITTLDCNLANLSISNLSNNIEKPSPFKSLKSQELVKLRKLIEKGNVIEVKKLIWENPRYLISSGDFPTILHEGCRYNALHVCAKSCNPEMMEMILETVSSCDFTNLLYEVTAENQSYIQRSDILLDLYCNTPDKTLNETPLHFAAKFGSLGCVQLLVACPKVNKLARNKDGKIPLDIVCSRINNCSESVKIDIKKLLGEDQFYVPIWRSSDACDVPLVGTPCKTPMTPNKMSMKLDESDVTSPTLEIKAFAGPMSESDAKAFRNKWKKEMKTSELSPLNTTPKRNTSLNASLLKSPQSVEKSFELVGRRLALENKIEWKENWPFLNKCIDLQSQQGLEMLENYLHNKYLQALMINKDSNGNNNIDGNSGANTNCNVSSGGHLQNHSNESNKDMSELSPIEKLRLNFDSLSLSSGSSHRSGSDVSSPVSSLQTSNTNTCHLLVEKSCEVFSNRLLQGIKSAAFDHNHNSLIKCLRQEAKHLNNMSVGFAQDERFQNIHLNRIHNLIAKVLASSLITNCPPECLEWVLKTFNQILQRNSLSLNYSNFDNDSIEGVELSNKFGDEEQDGDYHNEHTNTVLCIIGQILKLFEYGENSNVESSHSNVTSSSSVVPEVFIESAELSNSLQQESSSDRIIHRNINMKNINIDNSKEMSTNLQSNNEGSYNNNSDNNYLINNSINNQTDNNFQSNNNSSNEIINNLHNSKNNQSNNDLPINQLDNNSLLNNSLNHHSNEFPSNELNNMPNSNLNEITNDINQQNTNNNDMTNNNITLKQSNSLNEINIKYFQTKQRTTSETNTFNNIINEIINEPTETNEEDIKQHGTYNENQIKTMINRNNNYETQINNSDNKTNNCNNQINNSNIYQKQSSVLLNTMKHSKDFLYISSTSEKDAEKNWNLTIPCKCKHSIKPIFGLRNSHSLSTLRSTNRFNSSFRKGKRIDFDFETKNDNNNGNIGNKYNNDGVKSNRFGNTGKHGNYIGNFNEKLTGNVKNNKNCETNLDDQSKSNEISSHQECINKNINNFNVTTSKLSNLSVAETNYNFSDSDTSDIDDNTSDEYFTPPNSFTYSMTSSINDMMTSSDEEIFDDATDGDVEIYLVGSTLSKIDIDVYCSLFYCNSIVDCTLYPNIYKWGHFIQYKIQKSTQLMKQTRQKQYSPYIYNEKQNPHEDIGGGHYNKNYQPLKSSTPSGSTKQNNL